MTGLGRPCWSFSIQGFLLNMAPLDRTIRKAGDETMHAMRILGLAAMMAVTAAPLAAHAEPDQKNNRGYVVGKGGVARAANGPQADGGAPDAVAPGQTQQSTFGERVNAGLQQAGSAVASGAALVGAAPPGEHCVAGAPSCSDGAKPAKPTSVLKTKHDTVKNSIGNIR